MGHAPNQQTQSVTVAPTGGIGGVALFTAANAHTYYKNQPVQLGGTTAPTGFTLGNTYYVAPDQNYSDLTFALAATPSGAPIVASSAGVAVTTLMPANTFRVVRISKVIEEQWVIGQTGPANAKAYARDPTRGNQNQNWIRRRVYQNIGMGGTSDTEDVFEYIVAATQADDGT